MVERQPDADELKRTYDHLFADGDYGQYRREFEMVRSGKRPTGFYRRLLLRRVEKTIRGRHLLEIGGGTGSFGVLATSRGWRYTGYEISEVAVGFAKRLGLDVRLFDVEGPPPLALRSADIVVMWEVIEHIWNVHDYLRTINKALSPGGAFLFSTPNYAEIGYQRSVERGASSSSPPIHLNFFDGHSLKKAILANGYFDRIDIVKQRLYRPRSDLGEVARCVRRAMGLDEAATLYGTANIAP